MTDYNDGNWHGWDGGKCPVHPKSLVRTFFIHNGREPSTQSDGVQSIAGYQAWDCVIAFRVVKEYHEPRDFWIADIKGWKFSSAREAKAAFPGCDPIHVREVTE